MRTNSSHQRRRPGRAACSGRFHVRTALGRVLLRTTTSPRATSFTPSAARLAAILWPFALAALLFAQTVVAADAGEFPSGKPACCAKEIAPGAPLSDKSLYQLDSAWTNDAAGALKFVSLRGRPQVVSMFFASCQFTCPVLLNDMKRIEAALPENVRSNVGFVLVSFDSERDTPAALASYRAANRLPSNWTLLRGAPDDVLEFANLLGIKFKKDLRGQFAHSNVITVLDSHGEIAFQQAGLNRDTAPTLAALQKMLVPDDAVPAQPGNVGKETVK